MSENTEYIPQSAMSIHAHPDDQEFSIAGTLAKWAAAGCEIISVTITSGDSGCNEPDKDGSYKPVLAKIREEEQKAANDVIGIKTSIFMGYPDGELEPTIPLRKELARLIRQYKPEVVLTGDPQGVFYGNGYINHPDHRAAAQAALYATFPSAGTRLMFTDLLDAGYQPHNVKKVYVHGSDKPDTWVDISSTIDTKVAALRKHVSQLGDWDPEKNMREWATESGKEHNMAFAEEFRVMVLVEDKPEEKPEEKTEN